MTLSYAAFVGKWDARFADNDQFLIAAADLREYAHDVADSFGAALPNVPVYVAGTTYVAGYLVRYTVPVLGRECFYYALQAGLLPAPTATSDANWKLVPGPVAATALHQFISLGAAQGMDGDNVVPGRRYGVTGTWNGAASEELVYLDGLENYFRRRGTLLRTDGTQQEVEVDVQASTYQVAASGGGGAATGTSFQLTATSFAGFADMLLTAPAARLSACDGFFNAAGVQGQVLTLAGQAYRPFQGAVGVVAALNADLAAFWAEFGPQARALLRLRVLPGSPAIVAHAQVLFTQAPSTAPQALHPHNSGFRLFGNQFALTAADWNHLVNCLAAGGTLSSTGSFDSAKATNSLAYGNSGTGLRALLTARHNQANSYDQLGFTASADPSPNGSNFAAAFNLRGGLTVWAVRGGTKLAEAPYGGELLSLELWDDGLRWYVGATLLYHDPTPPAEAALHLGATFYTNQAAWLDVQAGGQTTTPR